MQLAASPASFAVEPSHRSSNLRLHSLEPPPGRPTFARKALTLCNLLYPRTLMSLCDLTHLLPSPSVLQSGTPFPTYIPTKLLYPSGNSIVSISPNLTIALSGCHERTTTFDGGC